MVLTIGAAYGLSRPGSVLHRPMLMLVLFTFLFGPGMYPSYLVVQKLGLFNNYLSLILPSALNAFNLIVLRAFFMNSVPGELIDAAKMDGAGEFRILFKIVLPMSKAILAVIALFYAVGYWNIYFQAVLYTPGLETQPIQVVLQRMLMSTQGMPGARHRPVPVRRGSPDRRAEDGRRGLHDRADRDHVPVHPEALHEGDHHRRHQGLTFFGRAVSVRGGGPFASGRREPPRS